MSAFESILLPLDASPEAAKGAGCALWLAERLGATLHVLHATDRPLPAGEALARLRVPQAQGARVILHQLPERAAAGVLEAIETHGVDLVVMSARGASASAGLALSQRLGAVAQAVIEASPVPVLLMPLRYREALPWKSMLVAASGEAAADEALRAAARLAAALALKVTALHAENGPAPAGTAPLGAYADAPHHEYGGRLDEMVERGIAHCTRNEAQCVDQVVLRRGDAASVLLEHLTRHGESVLALGSHGVFDSGRAPVLKRLLEEAECPLLLVRAPERSTTRLKVGDEIDEN